MIYVKLDGQNLSTSLDSIDESSQSLVKKAVNADIRRTAFNKEMKKGKTVKKTTTTAANNKVSTSEIKRDLKMHEMDANRLNSKADGEARERFMQRVQNG